MVWILWKFKYTAVDSFLITHWRL